MSTELGNTKLYLGPNNEAEIYRDSTTGNVTVKSTKKIILQVDSDNNDTSTAEFKNGAGTTTHTFGEDGSQTNTGSLIATGITATGMVNVHRPAESTATLTLTNSSAGANAMKVEASGGNALFTTPGSSTGFYCSSSIFTFQRLIRPDADITRDCGAAGNRWRDLRVGRNFFHDGARISTPINFTLGSNTPTVENGFCFRPNPSETANRTISSFTSPTEGQEIFIVGRTISLVTWKLANTGVFDQLNGEWTSANNATIHLIYIDSKWREISRR